MVDQLARFWKFVKLDDATNCWLWTGAVDRRGYGRFNAVIDGQKKMQYAHRVSYLMHLGPIAEGLQLDHICRVRHCVNPDHLEPVSSLTNTLRGLSGSAQNARKTHCPKGHLYNYKTNGAKGLSRYCRECNRLRAAALRLKLKI